MNRSIIIIILIGFSLFVRAQKDDNKLNYALIDAAANGNTDTLISFLKRNPNINYRDDNSGTALFYATQNNHLDIVKILVFNGAKMDYALDNGFTPLMSACYNGFFDIAEYLASQGASLDIRDEYWATALDYAVAMGDYYMVDMLLFYGANVLSLTYEETNTILIASLIGDTAIAQLLLNKNVDIDRVNKLGYSALSVAVLNNDSLMLDFLLSHSAKPQSLKYKYYSPYGWALLNKNIYAYNRLKPKQSSMQSRKNNRFNSLNIAYDIGDRLLIEEIKNEGISSGWFPYYNAVLFQANTSFNGDDVFYSFGVGLQDAKYKTDFSLNYGSRFRQKATLFEESDNTYLQLWEHRQYMEIYLQKRFEYQMDIINLNFYVGLGGQWMFGSYNGIHRGIDPSFAVVPKLGMLVEMNNVFFNLGYEYTPYQFYDISPHKIQLGIGMRFHFSAKTSQYSLLWI